MTGTFLGGLPLQALPKPGNPYSQGDLFQMRDPLSPCGIYLVADKDSTTYGQWVSNELTTEGLETFFNQESKEAFDPEKAGVFLVGDLHNRKAWNKTIKRFQKKLTDMGYPDLPVRTVRRIAEFLDDQSGVFVREKWGQGEWTRLGRLDNPKDIEKIDFTGLEKRNEILFAGAPLILGNFKDKAKDLIAHNGGSPGNIKFQSKLSLKTASFGELLQKLYLFPGTAFSTVWKKTIGMFAKLVERVDRGHKTVKIAGKELNIPWFKVVPGEDVQKPIKQEIESAVYKTTTSLILTSIVLSANSLARGQPLELNVLIPVTVVNALNSLGTGTAHTTMNNWIARSKSFFPENILKFAFLGAFFGYTIYAARSGSWSALEQALTLGGVLTYFQTKWMSILLQMGWRSPYETLVARWEREKNQKAEARLEDQQSAGEISEKDQAESLMVANEDIRQTGSAMKRMMSYVMTQFWVLSIILSGGFFRLVRWADGSLGFTRLPADQLGESGVILKNFNFGELAIIGTIIMAAIALNVPSVKDRIATVARAGDKWERKFHESMKTGFKKFLIKVKLKKPSTDE